jgi:TolA-binding protein
MSEYQVGYFYYRQRWYPGAVDRFRAIMKSDPGFTFRDAVYYYLAESLLKMKLDAEALPLYERLLTEFQQSEYLEESQQRVSELRAALAARGAPPPPGADAATAADGTAAAPEGAAPPRAQVADPQPD